MKKLESRNGLRLDPTKGNLNLSIFDEETLILTLSDEVIL